MPCLMNFKNCHTIKNIKNYLDDIRKITEKNMIKLHQLCTVGNKMLKHAIDMKVCQLYDSSGNKKIPDTISKYFNWDQNRRRLSLLF